MKRVLLLFMMLLLCVAPGVWAQTRSVSGQVLDETGQGLPGASVIIKGTTTGAATDVDGKFEINVPDGSTTLVVKGIGYSTEEIAITGSKLVIKLRVAATSLHETVITALGISRERRSLGYSQTTVDSASIERSGEQNVIEALAAKAPGVLVTSSAGTPGASAQILLRGNNNINGVAGQPLFVVDGIPLDNSTTQPVAGDYPYDKNLGGVNESNRGIDINPNDIESISVLRGPAAAALYGISGGNGAIIITTKKGHAGKGGRIGVDFNSSTEFSYVSMLPKMQNTYVQGAGGVYNPNVNTSWGSRADTSNIPTYDKYKDFFKTGHSYNNNVAISSATENSSIRLSLGDSKIDGIIPNTQFKRTTANLKADTKLSKFLSVGGDINYTLSSGIMAQNGSNTGGAMLTLFRAPINYNVKNYIDPVTGNQTQYFSAYDNPLFTVYNNPYTTVTNRVFGNLHATVNFSPSLTLTDRLGVDAYNNDTKQIYDISSVANDNADGSGQVNINSSRNFSLYNDLILRYEKKLSSDFQLTSLLGYNYQYFASSELFGRGKDLQVPDIYQLSNTNSLYASSGESYLRTSAIFGEVTIGYKSMLYLTGTGRNEWTSGYGRNGRSFFYPKLDGSWVFTELLPKSNVLTFGKIRAAFADAGTGPSPYTTIPVYYVQPFITDGNTNGVGFPYLGQQGYAPNNIFNDVHILPQHVQGREAGLELHMFHNRVTFEGTAYYQITLDNIVNFPIAPSSGYVSYNTNGGTARNEGIELSLNIDAIKKKTFTWSLFGNFSMDRSKVLSLNSNVSEIPTGNGFSEIGSYAIVGQPIGVFYGTAWLRDPATGKIEVGANGQAMVDPTARKVGDPNPDWTMGLGSTLGYKGFIFSFLWDIRHGGDIWDGTWARDNRLGVSEESADRNRTYTIDGVYAPGTPNAGKQNTTAVSSLYYYQTFVGDAGNYAVENSIQDGGWIRLRSVNLSYRFMLNKSKQKFIDYIEIGGTGRNLLLFTKYKGVDPETSLTGAQTGLRGYDYFNNPGTKSFMINVKLGL